MRNHSTSIGKDFIASAVVGLLALLCASAHAETLRGTVLETKGSTILMKTAGDGGDQKVQVRVDARTSLEGMRNLDELGVGDEIIVDGSSSNRGWTARSVQLVDEPGVWDRLRSLAERNKDWKSEKSQYEQKLENRIDGMSDRIDGLAKERAELGDEISTLEKDRTEIRGTLDKVRTAYEEGAWLAMRADVDKD